MLFNSPQFIFLFLPGTVAGYFLLAKFSRQIAASWLVIASFLFYASWNGSFTLLLLGSVCANYCAGYAIARLRANGRVHEAGWLLAVAIATNLLVLAYFKYAGFFINVLNGLTGTSLDIGNIVLPLGISFFTFTQIAFLVDTYRGQASEPNFIHYLLFVSYFPHLIAGPILHHAEMMPQFRRREVYVFEQENVAIGLTIFSIGLFKKVVLADAAGSYVAAPFLAENAVNLNFTDAWCAALAYTFQIYFDFSGYSDMAIGASRIFGIKLPLNFNSPYKATNIIEFWRRWHMTLSRFLRDYLYFPLGGNRHGSVRRYANLLMTMLLGGLWHGAGLTFVVWGGLHGTYLIVNHAWVQLRQRMGIAPGRPSAAGAFAAWLVTFLGVVFAWVFFRAPNMQVALSMVQTMIGIHGIAVPLSLQHQAIGGWLAGFGVRFEALRFTTASECLLIAGLLLIAATFPNTQQIMRDWDPALDFDKSRDERPPAMSVEPLGSFLKNALSWRANIAWAVLTMLIVIVSILSMSNTSTFLYYQF